MCSVAVALKPNLYNFVVKVSRVFKSGLIYFDAPYWLAADPVLKIT